MRKKPGASKPKDGENAVSMKAATVLAEREKATAGQKRPASTPPSLAPVAPSNAPDASCQQPKKSKTNEIDDIFGKKPANDKKSNAHVKDTAGGSGQQQAGAAEAPRAGAAAAAAVMGSKDDLFGAEAGKSRKRTEEGFTIYSEAELGLTKKGGGDTELCPFDCDCCY